MFLQTKLFIAWQDSFPQHCLTFHHWFEFYKKTYLITPEKCLQLQQIGNSENEANITEDWDDATSIVLPRLSSSPKIHLTDLYLQENSMILTAPDNSKLIQLQQELQNLRRLENAAINISDVIYNVQAWQKSEIALLVNGYSYLEIRPKLLLQGQKNFTLFSDYIKDIHLNKFFYEEVATEFDIFKLDLKTPKLHQEGQLQTFV